MNTRFLLATCLSFIVGSIFIAPETVKLGLSQTAAASLSHALLLAGMIAAILTVHAEACENAGQDRAQDEE
jgi:hypothetical protein